MTSRLRSFRDQARTLAKGVGSPRALAQVLARRAWSSEKSFGLVADLSDLPEPRRARVPVLMKPCEPRSFKGFADELERVDGDDALEVASRIRMCNAGVEQLSVATDPGGEPIYAQWLIDVSNQEALHTVVPRLFPVLGPDETLVEGAYTFVRSRRTGAMADGMHQLLVAASTGGERRCFTYVSAGNAPSLKGCARVGFELDHVRLTRRRLGRRSVVRQAPNPSDRNAWTTAVAPSR